MTNTNLTADDLLGCPSNANVKKALAFLEGFDSTTEAITSIVAALRGMDIASQAAIASMVEGLCEDIANTEVEGM